MSNNAFLHVVLISIQDAIIFHKLPQNIVDEIPQKKKLFFNHIEIPRETLQYQEIYRRYHILRILYGESWWVTSCFCAKRKKEM